MEAQPKPLRNEWSKLSIAELQENLNRIEKLLNKGNIHTQLSDGGARVKLKRESLKKEIQLRRDIDQLEGQMGQLTVGHSEPHVNKLCSMEKPPRERFVLNKGSKASSHAMMIDLGASLALQKAQGEREKYARDLKLFKEYVAPLHQEEEITDDGDSDNESSGNATHDSSDSDTEADDAQRAKNDDSGPS
ncbi:uncharacterized protein LOC126748691 [Anthonomus grandis grandis]|uniref:uncharacterized protein LOC126748691 n=1 Tax=Anthonomus grandis grandis TaxID=2921223 RepID=UPI0021668D31|nr:uncharacterized protein LOC126748691 [Anthonomus grandis grandis]